MKNSMYGEFPNGLFARGYCLVLALVRSQVKPDASNGNSFEHQPIAICPWLRECGPLTKASLRFFLLRISCISSTNHYIEAQAGG
jgi:hypothetical protein